MNKEQIPELIAAILTLSQGVDALHDIMRKNLSYSVDQFGGKIPDSFIPKAMEPSRERYEHWKKEI